MFFANVNRNFSRMGTMTLQGYYNLPSLLLIIQALLIG